jgi:uncharacterized membrane protein
MSKLTYAENPVHPVLNDYPAALIPASVVFDMLHLVTRRQAFKTASFFSLVLGLITGGLAAATGYRDYQAIPAGTEHKRMANAHGILNAGVLGAVALQVLLRITGKVGFFPRVLNLVTGATLMASTWYGTHLVYRHGLRVRGVDPLATAPAEADRGKALAEMLEGFLARVPDTDLSPLARRATDAATQVGLGAQSAIGTAAHEVGARTESIRGRFGGEPAAEGADWQADAADFDDQGAMSGSIAEGETVDVAATVRESLPDEAPR